MGQFLAWWLLLEALGLLGLPLTVVVLARLPDRGWSLAKPLSLLLAGWLIWLPLTAVSALPYSRLWIAGTLVTFAAGNAVLLLRSDRLRADLLRLLNRQRSYLIASEALFFLSFVGMLYLRSFSSAVDGTEKFMDMAFVSSLERTPHLPPPDPWLSGNPINYYYFGHFLVATLAKLLGTVPAVAFNLSIALVFALAAVAVFGVATNVTALRMRAAVSLMRASVGGFVAVVFVLVLGNLAGAQEWWKEALAASTAHPGATAAVLASPWQEWLHPALWQSYFWWGPSRVVDNAITEFPAFSFLLADLHAHVLALPFAALALGISMNLLLSGGEGVRAFGQGWQGALCVLVSAVSLGSLYAINGWDLPTYLGLAVLALLIQQWFAHGRRFSTLAVVDALTACALLCAVAVLAFLPFYRGFDSPSGGVGVVPLYVRTPIGEAFAMFGLPIFVVGSFLVTGLGRALCARHLRGMLLAIGGACVVAVLTLVTQAYAGWTLLWCLLIVLLCVWLALDALGLLRESPRAQSPAALRLSRADVWMYCLAGTAAALVGVCELIYLRDVFGGGPDFRMNTVFKLYYQAWLLLGVVSGPACVALVGVAWRTLHARITAEKPGSEVRRAHEVMTGAPRSQAARIALAEPNGAGPVSVSLSAPANPGDAPADPEAHKRQRALRRAGTGGIVVWIALLVVLVLAAAVYPVLGVAARTQNFSASRTLDGAAFMRQSADLQGDYAAIQWINTHIAGDAVLVEGASYDEYQHYGRVSAFTGLPTILDWGGHEVQWRYNWLAAPQHTGEIDTRLQAVKTIYTSPSDTTVLSTLHEYSARYVYVGEIERQLYPNANLQRLSRFLRVIYQQDGVTIYAVP